MTKHLCAIAGILLVTPAIAGDLHFISWNVESGGADPEVIAKQLGELPRADIYALQEVDGKDIDTYGHAIQQSHGESFQFSPSMTGGSDRLLVAYDTSKLTLFEWREVFHFNDVEISNWQHRSPLVCLFKDRATGQKFYFVTVHLERGDEERRNSQARGLTEWADDVDVPVIAVGVFNLDFDIQTQQGNEAFLALRVGEVWKWAKPEKLVDSTWTDENRDGVDDAPHQCDDFAFYVGWPSGWKVTSEFIVRPGDFPDNETTSNHRPLIVRVSQNESGRN